MNDTLTCEVVSWRDEPRESSGWHRICVRALDDTEHTVTGCNLPRPGSRCEFRGEWQTTKWGDQFHVWAITATKPPLTAAGVARWLEDRCNGIGKVKAAAILAHFGNDPALLWTALELSPYALQNVPGLNAEVSAHVHECFEAEGVAREHYATLRGWKLTQAQITRILKHWPIEEACRRLYADPYLLAEHINGFGFLRADAIATGEIGIERTSRLRLRAAILHALSEAAQAGHVYGDAWLFQNISQTFLRVPMAETVAVLEELIAANRVVSEDGARMYLPTLARAEQSAAAITRSMLGRDAVSGEDYTRVAIEEAAAHDPPRTLHPKQLEAINLAADLGRPFGLITGGPGTGKTTILRYAILELQAQGKYVVLAAPTGKAAKRMTEATGVAAQTLHRLLEYKPEGVTDCETCQRTNGRFEGGALEHVAIFVDEASMVDLHLWAVLMRAVRETTVVRFIGDADQLPPVGPGQPFADHLRALNGSSAIVRLESVYRQGQGSWVAEAAPLVLAGKMPPLEARHDFRFIEVHRADQVPVAIEALLNGVHDDAGVTLRGIASDSERVGRAGWTAATLQADYVPRERAPTGVPAPILVPQHKGLAGVATINRMLSEHYLPHAAAQSEQELIRIPLEDGTDLRVGARVLCLKNDYKREVRNGDTGVIEAMVMERDKRGEPRPSVLVRLDADERTAKDILEAQRTGAEVPATPLITYNYAQAREELTLAYAMTIHKSQGSQYPWIVVVCHSSHSRMLTRRLLYTALTRASEGVVLVGNRDGIERALANTQEAPRNTWLRRRLEAST